MSGHYNNYNQYQGYYDPYQSQGAQGGQSQGQQNYYSDPYTAAQYNQYYYPQSQSPYHPPSYSGRRPPRQGQSGSYGRYSHDPYGSVPPARLPSRSQSPVIHHSRPPSNFLPATQFADQSPPEKYSRSQSGTEPPMYRPPQRSSSRNPSLTQHNNDSKEIVRQSAKPPLQQGEKPRKRLKKSPSLGPPVQKSPAKSKGRTPSYSSRQDSPEPRHQRTLSRNSSDMQGQGRSNSRSASKSASRKRTPGMGSGDLAGTPLSPVKELREVENMKYREENQTHQEENQTHREENAQFNPPPQKTVNMETLISDFNEEDRRQSDSEILVDPPVIFGDLDKSDNEDPLTDSEDLPGKGSPPVPNKPIKKSFQGPPTKAFPPLNANDYQDQDAASTIISSLEAAQYVTEKHRQREAALRLHALQMHAKEVREHLSQNSDDYETVTTVTHVSEPEKKSQQKLVAIPDKYQDDIMDHGFSYEQEEFVGDNYDTAGAGETEDQKADDADEPDLPPEQIDVPNFTGGDDFEELFHVKHHDHHKHTSNGVIIKRHDDEDDLSATGSDYSGNLSHSDDDDNDDPKGKKKKKRGPVCTNLQGNLYLGASMATLGLSLLASTVGTANDWYIWLGIVVTGCLMVIASFFSLLYTCLFFWDFEDFKKQYDTLEPVMKSADFQSEIENMRRKEVQRKNEELQKLIDEKKQIAKERAQMLWDEDCKTTQFWLCHDFDDLESIDFTQEEDGPRRHGDLVHKPKPKKRKKSSIELLRIFRKMTPEEQYDLMEDYIRRKRVRKTQRLKNKDTNEDAQDPITSKLQQLDMYNMDGLGNHEVKDQHDKMVQLNNKWESESLVDKLAPLFLDRDQYESIEMAEMDSRQVRFTIGSESDYPASYQGFNVGSMSQGGSTLHYDHSPDEKTQLLQNGGNISE